MKMKKRVGLGVVVALLGLAGCGTNGLDRPQMAGASKDGAIFVDLRNGPFEFSHPDLRAHISRLLSENCTLPVNANHPFCIKPSDYLSYVGQVSNGLWLYGPNFVAVVVPKNLGVRVVKAPSEKDGDIIRARIIPGPVSMFSYDGIIERHDDPNRACKWEGMHNYSGGVVCPKYGYTYKNLDLSKFR